MSPVMGEIARTVEREIRHSRDVGTVFLRALCLFETHYQETPSSLLKLFPDLTGQTIDDEEIALLSRILMRFIDECPIHLEVKAAIWLLSLTGEPSHRDFLIAQLRRHLAWRNTSVVDQLLVALDRMGERVFYDAEGKQVRIRRPYDSEAIFSTAQRYLERHDNGNR
jgi:hypothetical protein